MLGRLPLTSLLAKEALAASRRATNVKRKRRGRIEETIIGRIMSLKSEQCQSWIRENLREPLENRYNYPFCVPGLLLP